MTSDAADGPGDPARGAGDADRELVDRYLTHRDESAFTALYRRHSPVLFRFALRRVRGREAAEAVVQETWLRAARGLERFAWRSSLRSWLTGIALNCCRERCRSDGRTVPIGDGNEGRMQGTAAPTGGLRVDLERAVDALPERAREVLLLHVVEGYSHAEVAAALGIEEGTSKSQLSRARAKLRRVLRTEEREHG